MSGESSEEKSEPASDKKLRDQRKKGKIAKGPDLMVAITTGPLIGYVLIEGHTVTDQGGALIDAAARSVAMPFTDAAPLMIAAMRSALVACALPPLLIAVAAAVLGSLLVNKGFVFSLEPLMPKPEKLNPVSGLKNLYKASAWIEFAKSLVKAALFGGALLGVAVSGLEPLLEVPACSPGCVPSVLRAIVTPLLGAAAVFYLVSGVVDLLIQRWQFLRENRMTKTEVKQERKDTLGNPQTKREQRRLRAEAGATGRLGLARATCLLCGARLMVGLRFVKGETMLPIVVCRAVGDRSVEMFAAARAIRVPIYLDKELAAELDKKIKPGQMITQPFFARVARAIQRARA